MPATDPLPQGLQKVIKPPQALFLASVDKENSSPQEAGPVSPCNPSLFSESSSGTRRCRLLQDHLEEEKEKEHENPFHNTAHHFAEQAVMPPPSLNPEPPIPPYAPHGDGTHGQAAAAFAGICCKYSRRNYIKSETHHPAFQRMLCKCEKKVFKVCVCVWCVCGVCGVCVCGVCVCGVCVVCVCGACVCVCGVCGVCVCGVCVVCVCGACVCVCVYVCV